MKKFTFSLENIKSYKESLLDNLKLEHAAILAEIAAQKKLIESMEMTERLVNSELNEKNSRGIAPHEHANYRRYLKVLENDIKLEYEKLYDLEKKEDDKRKEVVEMKKETSTLEKLEEKKLEEYNGLMLKDHELFIEEFVSNQKYVTRR